MAEHGDPCEVSDASYCMNGGTCYQIPSMSTITCVCSDDYKGSRCQEYQLFITSRGTDDNGLTAAVVTVSLLIFLILILVIYYAYRIWKKRTQNQQTIDHYWRVKPRAYGWRSGCISSMA